MNEDIEKMESELKSLPGVVELVFYGKDEDPLSTKLGEYLDALSEASSGKLAVVEGSREANLPGRPAFAVKGKDGKDIHYLALPEANEVAPFLKALHFAASGKAPLDPDVEAVVAGISSAAEIWVFVSPFCTNCPRVVETVLSFSANNSLLNATIIDV